mgnify:FL=1
MDAVKKRKQNGKRPLCELFRQVCEANAGIIGDVASALRVRRSTVYMWCSKYPEFRQALDDARETFLDLAESNLHKLVAGVPAIETDENGNKRFAGWIERPSETAIIFTLKTRGKSRGYVERSEIAADVHLRGSINIREWVKDRLRQQK